VKVGKGRNPGGTLLSSTVFSATEKPGSLKSEKWKKPPFSGCQLLFGKVVAQINLVGFGV
jgi:hypothetical protein